MNLRLIFSLALFFCCTKTFAQLAGDYQFSSSIGAFTPLIGSTDLDTLEDYGEVSDVIEIGFPFQFEGTVFYKLKVCTNGWISFDTNVTIAYWQRDLSHGLQRPMLAPLLWSLSGIGSGCKASYKTDGAAGNRVFTMEWLYWQWSSVNIDSVISFQVKIFESTNIIEFHYRQEVNAATATVCAIGISGRELGPGHFLSLDSATSSPSVSNQVEYSIWSAPQSNQVYRFTPPGCSAPADQFYTNATYSTIDVNWRKWITSSNNFNLQFDSVGFQLGTGSFITNISSNIYQIAGLKSETRYDFYVRDSCGMGIVSTWRGPYSINTAYPVPFTETFESINFNLRGNLPNGWICRPTENHKWLSYYHSSSVNGTGPMYDHTTNSSSGIYMVASSKEGKPGDTAMLYSPFYNLDSMDHPVLQYWSHRWGQGFGPGYVDIYVNGSWILGIDSIIGSTQNFTNDPYLLRSINLTSYLGNFIRIRWRSIRNTNQGDWAIDDVSIHDNAIYLKEPKTDSVIDINGEYSKTVRFNWTSSFIPENPKYHFILDTSSVFAGTPLINNLSVNNGGDTIYNLSYHSAGLLLASLNLAYEDTVNLYWTVYSEKNNDTIFALDTFRIRLIYGKVMEQFNLTSPSPFSQIDVKGNKDRTTSFQWTKSADGLKYIWDIYSASKPTHRFTLLSDTNMVTISNNVLDSLLDDLNVSINNKHLFNWDVAALLDDDTLSSFNGHWPVNLNRLAITKAFHLIGPSTDTMFLFLNNPPLTSQKFTWEEAQINGNDDIVYSLVIAKESNDFSYQLLKIISDNTGRAEVSTVMEQSMIYMFNTAGNVDGDTLRCKWTVITDVGDTANEPFIFTIIKDQYFGVSELKEDAQITLYPIPASQNLCIDARNSTLKPDRIDLLDASGRLIISTQVLEKDITTLNISKYESGLYIVKAYKDLELLHSEFVAIIH